MSTPFCLVSIHFELGIRSNCSGEVSTLILDPGQEAWSKMKQQTHNILQLQEKVLTRSTGVLIQNFPLKFQFVKQTLALTKIQTMSHPFPLMLPSFSLLNLTKLSPFSLSFSFSFFFFICLFFVLWKRESSSQASSSISQVPSTSLLP